MQAILLRELGGPENFRLETVPDPSPGPDEVLVRLKTAALNHRDLFARVGLYPGIKLPAIPGSDGAGEIAALGPGVTGWSLGSAVVINPALQWGDNPRFYGRDYSILGIPTNGTLAQYVVVPATNVLAKPVYLSWQEAAALPLAGLTAYRALFSRGGLKAGETVLIPGIGGGVASVLLQMAVAAGARVFVTSGHEAKLDRARALGAAGGVNYHQEGWVKLLRNMMGAGADLSLDSVGGPTFADLITLAKPGGRIVVFGSTAGPVPNLVMPRLFFKQLDVLGTTMGSPEDFAALLKFCETHRLRPVVDRTYALDQIVDAQQRMEKGEQFGKIVVEIP